MELYLKHMDMKNFTEWLTELINIIVDQVIYTTSENRKSVT